MTYKGDDGQGASPAVVSVHSQSSDNTIYARKPGPASQEDVLSVRQRLEYTPVDLKGLSALLQELESRRGDDEAWREYASLVATDVTRVMNSATPHSSGSYGLYKPYYDLGDSGKGGSCTGRLYERPMILQAAERCVKAAALSNLPNVHNYDLVSAQAGALLMLGRQLGLGDGPDFLATYQRLKARGYLYKEAFLAMFFGQTAEQRVAKYGGGFSEAFLHEAREAVSYVEAVSAELFSSAHRILDGPVVFGLSDGNLINAVGFPVSGRPEMKHWMLSALQGFEQAAVHRIVRSTAARVITLEHDGFVCLGEVEKDLVERVFKETGWEGGSLVEKPFEPALNPYESRRVRQALQKNSQQSWCVTHPPRSEHMQSSNGNTLKNRLKETRGTSTPETTLPPGTHRTRFVGMREVDHTEGRFPRIARHLMFSCEAGQAVVTLNFKPAEADSSKRCPYITVLEIVGLLDTLVMDAPASVAMGKSDVEREAELFLQTCAALDSTLPASEWLVTATPGQFNGMPTMKLRFTRCSPESAVLSAAAGTQSEIQEMALVTVKGEEK